MKRSCSRWSRRWGLLRPEIQIPQELCSKVFCCVRGRIQPEFRIVRCLIGAVDAGEIGQFAPSGLAVKPLGVPLLGDVERRVDKNLHEFTRLEHFARHAPLCPEGGDEGCHDDQAGVRHQPGHLGDASDVFHPVGVGKAEITVETEADIVTVENIGVIALTMQFELQCIGNG